MQIYFLLNFVEEELLLKTKSGNSKLNEDDELRLIQKISNQNKYIPIEECGFSL